MEQQLSAQEPNPDEATSQSSSRALWQRVRKPQRERLASRQVEFRGPYETSYSVASGYPDREVLRP